MWKKGAFLLGAYVAVSLCEWASRLVWGAERGLLAWAWRVAEPVLLFVYSMGEVARVLIRMIRLEDGVSSFVDTAVFVARVLAGALDFVWGMVGAPFWEFLPGTIPSVRVVGIVVVLVVSACISALVWYVGTHMSLEPQSAPAESEPAPPPDEEQAKPPKTTRVGRSTKNKQP